MSDQFHTLIFLVILLLVFSADWIRRLPCHRYERMGMRKLRVAVDREWRWYWHFELLCSRCGQYKLVRGSKVDEE